MFPSLFHPSTYPIYLSVDFMVEITLGRSPGRYFGNGYSRTQQNINRFDHFRDGVECYKCNDEKEVAHEI